MIAEPKYSQYTNSYTIILRFKDGWVTVQDFSHFHILYIDVIAGLKLMTVKADKDIRLTSNNARLYWLPP